MSNIVSFMPVERLDDLVAATGFNLDYTTYESKFTWLVERIGLLREQATRAAILHDYPEKDALVAQIMQERSWSAAQRNTIASLLVQIENGRQEIERLKREQAA